MTVKVNLYIGDNHQGKLLNLKKKGHIGCKLGTYEQLSSYSFVLNNIADQLHYTKNKRYYRRYSKQSSYGILFIANFKGLLKLNNMEWYQYLACFFAGAFCANTVPHFVHGVSGDKFPTPFAKPPGEGLSSPTVNVVWSLFNIVIGYLLIRAGGISCGEPLTMALFLAGIAFISIVLSIRFQKKHKS